MKHLSSLVRSAMLAAALMGCAGTSSSSEAAAPPVARDINRADAIASAREDARRTYGTGWGSQVDAHYQGGFWMVELYASSGYKLRYAISAHDGGIRERNMVQ